MGAVLKTSEPPVVAESRRPPGLKRGAIGLASSTVIGIASTAPAYSLAATIGLIALAAGYSGPIVLILAFVPMIFVAISFDYLNRADPDCGTTFSWVTRAFGPSLGWLNGWVIIAADIVVMSNLAQIAGDYSLGLVGVDAAPHAGWSTVLGVGWMAFMTVIVMVGIEASARTQWLLLGFEWLILLAFAALALFKVYAGSVPGSTTPSWSWFDPFSVQNGSTGLLAGILLAVFIYWGWDSAVNVNEETRGTRRTPGLAAIVSTVALLFIYVVVDVAAQAFAGPQTMGANSGDVLGFLGRDVFGSGWEKLLVLAVLTSAAASTQTTILPTARVTLSMARAGAAPRWLGTIHPRWQTPWLSTLAMGIISAAVYVVLTSVSSASSILVDSISALGLLIAFYYGFTGIASAVYFRRLLGRDPKTLLMAGILPLLGGLALIGIFAKELYDLNNASSSTAIWFGFGSADVIGVGLILIGVVLLVWARFAYPRFFQRRAETADSAALDAGVTGG